jgi:hypothetical protein
VTSAPENRRLLFLSAGAARASLSSRERRREKGKLKAYIVRADSDRTIHIQRLGTEFAVPHQPAINEDVERNAIQRGGQSMRGADLRRLDRRRTRWVNVAIA